MSAAQGGIFALGTASHAYLEIDAVAGSDSSHLVAAVASLREPRTTMGASTWWRDNRPELWRAVVPDNAPVDLAGFDEDLVGIDSFVMPARHSTTPCSGCLAVPTTWSSTLPARRSPSCAASPRVADETSS
jgi:hypothetical protein